MKKSKLIFAIVAAVIFILCIVVMMFSDPNDSNTALEVSDPTSESTEQREPLPMESIYVEYPDNPHEFTIASNVRINQVEKDPNEIIHYNEPVLEGDPEYIAFKQGKNYGSAEGKVYRNDKTISIDIFDEYLGKIVTFTFGYVTGQCNTFLYLNPVCEQATADYQYGFYFNVMPSSGGSVVTIPQEYDTEEALKKAQRAATNFTVLRTLDQRSIAEYVDPQHPGTVWFTQTPMSGSFQINCIVYQMGGDFVASLDLTISKDSDGTYSIVNLQNNNLLQLYSEPDAAFSKDELGYIYTKVVEVMDDPDLIQIASSNTSELSIERTIMEYRDSSTGLYYQYFVPSNSHLYAQTSDYLLDGPVVAVTVRQYQGFATGVTLYFRIVKPATDSAHGTYEYIGRDFLYYNFMETLINQGYPAF